MMRKINGPHSYEELRGVVIDILLGKETITYGVGNYRNLVDGVAEVLVRRGASYTDHLHYSGGLRMEDREVELVRDIFWDLFRQCIVILGRNDMNDGWPNFRLSHNATQTLLKSSPYRFHDDTSYLTLVRTEAPDVSQDAQEYLHEAIATYYTDCLLASSIMLGVAAEIEFLRLISAGIANPTHAVLFQPADAERQLRQKILKFQAVLPSLPKALLLAAGEDLDMHINAIQSVLRVARNKAGHALAKRTVSREQMYVYLQLFVPFVGHVERLRKAL
jgi:hypothetical protein